MSIRNINGGIVVYQGDKHTRMAVDIQLNVMKEVRIEDTPVVREFQDVFPAELPGMPPDREI